FEVVWKHIEGQLGPLEESMLLRIQILRVEARHLRARAALASAAVQNREERLRIADNLARKIQKEPLQWAEPLAALIRAAIAAAGRDKPTAVTLLSGALEGFSTANMALYEAASRRRLGEAVGGERGRQLIAAADNWMARQRIQNPARMTQMLAPGFENLVAY
ncbi:MAG TPA: hypothetical protein VI750_06925, partial [Pyrinomonadaceae bacterium]|nr:hypothetical protein [Pyrinomonadaceae bacterium]